MSDIFEGPGFWMASDGKWYAPDRHPDPSYRERFVLPVVLEPPSIPVEAEPEPDVAQVEPEPELVEPELVEPELVEHHDEFPTVDIESADESRPTSTPLSDIHRTVREAEIQTAQVPEEEPSPDPEVVHAFSVAAPVVPKTMERPVFESLPPASVVSSPTAVRRNDDTAGVELEIERPPTVATRHHPGTAGPSIGAVPPSTSLAVVAEPVTDNSPATFGDRVVAGTIFAAGVAMIVGTFLDWTTGSLVQTGWDRGDGIATVIAGVIGSAAAGPIYVGFRHILPKSVAIAAGLIGLVVIGLTAISVLFDNASADTSVGIGFLIVFIGSTAMAIAGLADRGELPS